MVDEDMIVEDEPPQREKDLSSPTGVEGRRKGVLRGFHRGDRRATEEALRGGHLGGQSGTQGTLSLQGEGGGAHTLPRGHHSRLDRSEGVDE